METNSSKLRPLIKQLHTVEGCACVVNNQETRTYSRRGIDDLYDLLLHDPDFLHGADVADRVVGKAIAAIMVKGGVRNVHADLISLPALMLLRKSGIYTSYCRVVTFIKNRRRTDWCPVEALCYHEENVDSIIPIISEFVAKRTEYLAKPTEGNLHIH